MSTPSWRHFPKSRKPARDFHRPRYGNPLFNPSGSKVVRRNSSSTNRSARKGDGGGFFSTARPGLWLAGLVIVGALWYVFWGPTFRVTKTEFSGATPSTEETLRKALTDYTGSHALLIFPRDNVLLFSESGAKNAIKDAVYLDDIDISKKLPDTVIITVKEKAMRAVLERDGRLYGVDDSGYVLRELTSQEHDQMPDLPPGLNAVDVQGLGAQSVDVSTTTVPATGEATTSGRPAAGGPTPEPLSVRGEGGGTPAAGAPSEEAAPPAPPKNAWPLLLDRTTGDVSKQKPIHPGLQAFSAATVSVAMQATARLTDVTGETVRWFTPDASSDSVDATMSGGWHVFLATTTPFDIQVDRLSIVLKDKIGPRRDKLEYVDLRYNERIFFRLKDETK